MLHKVGENNRTGERSLDKYLDQLIILTTYLKKNLILLQMEELILVTLILNIANFKFIYVIINKKFNR